MDNDPCTKAGVTAPARAPRQAERLLGISDVCNMTGLAPVTASKLMKETGRALRIHGRVFVLESSFFAYLREMEVANPCSE